MTSNVVLITGALTGIGRATALAFAQEGARIVVSGRRDEAGRALAAELRALGADAEYLRADVRREEDVRDLVEKTVKWFGRLDVAVNNAGTEGRPGPVTEILVDSYNAAFETNVLGTLLSLKHELRVMLAQGHGSIVNLSSVLGQVGVPGASEYVASKHAVEGLTKEIAETILFLHPTRRVSLLASPLSSTVATRRSRRRIRSACAVSCSSRKRKVSALSLTNKNERECDRTQSATA